jgi:hypothetical protein
MEEGYMREQSLEWGDCIDKARRGVKGKGFEGE